MSTTLYGSGPSPFVRRIRLLLEEGTYEFVPINILAEDDLKILEKVSPIRKLPVLIDNGHTLFDSHLISEYLLEKQGKPSLSIEDKNTINVIDAVTDSLVVLLLSNRSGFDTNEDKVLFNLQNQRIPVCLQWLEEKANEVAFDEWHYPTIALLAMVEWAEYRHLYDFSNYPAIAAKLALHKQRDIVVATAPT